METKLEQKPQVKIMEVLRTTPITQIAELPFVREKFVANFNHCHKGGQGDIVYYSQMAHLKQLVTSVKGLKEVDPFSIYACFMTVAVNNYSLDPADMEVYMYPRDGKAVLDRQAGAHVRKLKNSCQILSAEQVQLVYEGDVFEVEKGKVVSHKEKFESEIYRAAYVIFKLDSRGTEKHIIYRKSDWEAWKKKSKQADKENWSGGTQGQPIAAFLRTKVMKHAAMDKSWASGSRPNVEEFGVEIDSDIEDVSHEEVNTKLTVNNQGAIETPSDDDSFATSEVVDTTPTVTHTDDDF